MAKRHSLITIPPEINRLILELLSSHDFMALRHTSRDFYRYFASEEISHFAQKLYFPLSAESKKVRRTRFDLDCTYERSQRWKEGKPSNVTIINEVADGSASLSNGFLVDTEASLLAYQRARAIVVLKDLQCTDDSADVVIDLEKAASPCMGTRNQGIFLRDGESVRLAMNRGILLCIGEAHIHPSTNEPPQDPPGRGLSIFSSILNWGNPPPRTNIPPRQFFEHPHSACAVFSTKKEDRGRLIASWFERDSFIWMVAVNEFYAIAEFDLVEQRLEGYIYPTADSQKSMKGTSKGHGNKSDGKHDGYHFTIKKKSLYPPLSTFSVAADTRGKVFYLGFLPPSAERRPVVEVHSVPQYDPSNKSWSACTIIKRITLRSLGRHAGELNGSILNSSFWINLDQGTTVKELKGPKIEPSGPFARDPGEDIVRIRMTGDLYIPGITNTDEQQVSMVTWDITSRPSPHKPSSITEWRAGKEWEVDPDIDFDSISLYKNAEGKVDFEELYPSPTYYTRNRKREVFMTELRIIPRTLDFDCLMANNEIGLMPSLYWMKDINNKNKSACAVYCSIEPGTIVRDPKPEQPDNGGVIFAPHGEAVEFPLDPGRNDKDFVPAGIHMIAKYKVILDVGRKVTIRNTAKSKPVLPTTSASPQSPKRKSRFFGRIWTDYIYQHRASRSNNRISTTVDIMATDTIDGVSSNSSSSETVTNTTSAFTEVDLPFPGMEEHRDKILTKMDHGNKRYWVYGKEAETIDKGLPSQTRVGDKIVIVRFD